MGCSSLRHTGFLFSFEICFVSNALVTARHIASKPSNLTVYKPQRWQVK